jgi:hypothetical protein
MDTPQLITLIRGVSALEARGDGIGRPMDSSTLEAVSAFRTAMLRRLVACHLTGSELTIDTESLVSLNDALVSLERDGDGALTGISRDETRLSADLRGALLDRIRFHPGGNAIARLMARLSPPPLPEATHAPSPAPQPVHKTAGLPPPPFVDLPAATPASSAAAEVPAAEPPAAAPGNTTLHNQAPTPRAQGFAMAADDSLAYGAPPPHTGEAGEAVPHPRTPVAA